ncbi:hypothetical protein NA63_1420 [Flavobacteriaceae bacterium MAR_2010_105]|nr:hypothetical protein NA63_1420 [Flavobacteriaceae bacterium MAR_2010_105]
MKNILKQFMIITIGALTVFSCDYDDSEWDKLHNNAPDPSASYYVQFKDPTGAAAQTQSVILTPQGLQEISVPVVVGLNGLPQSQDITVNVSVDASSTAAANMYSLGATSLVIPAGETAGSTTLTSVLDNMPIDEEVTIVLNLDAGANTAGAGTKITYYFLRPEICLPVPGDYRVDMHDSWGDGWQTSSGTGGPGIQVTIDGVVTEVTLASGFEGSAIVTIPDPSFSVSWYFPGDWYGEISFEIYDPSDNLVFSRAAAPASGAPLDFEVCQ